MFNHLVDNNTYKSNIFVIDDNPSNLLLLTEILTEEGYVVNSDKNGRLALAAIQSSPPDLILLDINMPEIDGYEICSRLKSNPQTNYIPIIFVSALNDLQDRQRAFELGGADYIAKPFIIIEVIQRVKTHISLQICYQQLQNKTQKYDQLKMLNRFLCLGMFLRFEV